MRRGIRVGKAAEAGHKAKAMSDDEALDALASDGKLIKRPFLITENGSVLLGFKPEVWAEALLR